ncbi:MAG: cysteine desulfurase family protein [Actinomycetota bacterium]
MKPEKQREFELASRFAQFRHKPIYVDYNATTPVDPAVLEEMFPYFSESFGNPSSFNWYGLKAKEAIDQARSRVADCLGCQPHEIIFTSGGTESNNLAIKGVAYACQYRGNHIITSAIEHPSVYMPCEYLRKQGFDITYVPVDEYGIVSVDDIRNAIKNSTILISVMHANNEVGTIQPIEEIGLMSKELGIYFHTDAAQSFGKIPVNVDDLGVDLLTLTGHKFYAPKCSGALYVREGTKIDPLINGSPQEFGLRAGTESVPSIVGLGKACHVISSSLEKISDHLLRLRERLFEQLVSEIPGIRLNGHPTQRVPNTLNISFPGVHAKELLAATPEIAASTGVMSHSQPEEISHVLKAMGVEERYALGAIRLSVGRWTSDTDVDDIVDYLSSRYFSLVERKTA